MPYRKVVLAQDQIYHVFNRGVARLPIFLSTTHYRRFLQLVDYYRFCKTPISFSKLIKLPVDTQNQIVESLKKENDIQVEILAFCLMENHFHFLLKQIAENGIMNFMRFIQNGYVKYLNTKEGRVGPLFQSTFRAVRIESDEQLLHVSRYIHLNPVTEYLVEIKDIKSYPWSSLPHYINEIPSLFSFLSSKLILDFFKNKSLYQNFVLDQAEYQRELEKIKHLAFE